MKSDGVRWSKVKWICHWTFKLEIIIKEWVGIRPGRDGGPRIDVMDVDGVLVVNNYGHAGLGVTLSWSSAYQVLDLLQQLAEN